MIRVVELFSGIGSQAKAIKNVCSKRKEKYKILNTCEWDIHAIVAYDYIHNGFHLNKNVLNMSRNELLAQLSRYNLSGDGKVPLSNKTLNTFNDDYLRRILSSIKNTHNLINIKDLKGEQLPADITILTYSFPCQDLSNVGALHGYNKGIDRNANTRSGLLWEVERILLERNDKGLDLPKFLLLENVTALEASRHRANFEEWQNRLTKLGYINIIYKLYAPDFGIPQNRRRLLMLSVYVGDDDKFKDKVLLYKENHNLENKEYLDSLNIKKKALADLLKLDYTNKVYFEEAILSQPNNTPSRKTIWNKNSIIYTEEGKLNKIVQTITTKQDRHPNSGNLYFDYENNKKAKYRFLTPRECFLLMGFDENDFNVLINNNFCSSHGSFFFSRDKMYKLAGNSIVVNMLEAIFNQVLDLIEIYKTK